MTDKDIERTRIEKLREKYPLLLRAESIKTLFELMTYKGNSEGETENYYKRIEKIFKLE